MSGQNYQNMMQPNMATLHQAQTPTGVQPMPQLAQALNQQQIMQKFNPGVGTLAQQPNDTYMSRPRYSSPGVMNPGVANPAGFAKPPMGAPTGGLSMGGNPMFNPQVR